MLRLNKAGSYACFLSKFGCDFDYESQLLLEETTTIITIKKYMIMLKYYLEMNVDFIKISETLLTSLLELTLNNLQIKLNFIFNHQ